jgi:hypothetical protein
VSERRRVGVRLPDVTNASRVVETAAGIETGIHRKERSGTGPADCDPPENKDDSEHLGAASTHAV